MLKIETDFARSPGAHFYRQALETTLERLLPPPLFAGTWDDNDTRDEAAERWIAQLPLIVYDLQSTSQPFHLSLYGIWPCRQHAFRFILDMVRQWLCPGIRLNILIFFAIDFRLPEMSQETYNFFQIDVALPNAAACVTTTRTLPTLLTELRLGIESQYHAWRILEIKGLHVDDKTAIIQEQISYLIKRKPNDFDQSLITEMQHMLVMWREDFLSLRNSRHLSRLISAQYLFRKQLRELVTPDSSQRHLKLKLYKTKLRTHSGWRSVLGILVCINFIGKQELFEERHLMKAVRSYLSGVASVEGSCFSNRRSSDHTCTLYLEVEKESGEEFTAQEINLLRVELPYDLQDRIEHMMSPVFMPRNEEEILRNILNLSIQIKYSNDLPQAFIAFDEQMRDSLIFTVIMVRVGIPGEKPLNDRILETISQLEYLPDRCKMIGMLRKKHVKEAHVFRLKFSKADFIRDNGSIDLNRARQLVVNELTRILGEFRDYNGGMISKQNELLCTLRGSLHDKAKYNDLLLENFFYALMPVEMRTLLEAPILARLFTMLLEVIDEGLFKNEATLFRSCIYEDALLIIASSPSLQAKEELLNLGNRLALEPETLAYSYVQVYNIPYFCYILRGLTEELRETATEAIQHLLEESRCLSRNYP